MSKKAFTLIELLIVVLIIGILSAIALPMYQGAVDKSHWSTMLPGAKAIKDAEEAFKMSNDGYTDTMANLDVTMENSDLTFNLITPNNTSDPNVIRVTNSKLANVRLASYLDDNPKFAGQLHCEALTGDERANRLCGKLLGGQELTSDDGHERYLLDQAVTRATCGDASGSWSSSKTKCYKDASSRCEALGMSAIAGQDKCAYTGVGAVGAEAVCIGDSGSCNNKTIEAGGTCETTLESGRYGCNSLIMKPGSTCISRTGGTQCTGGSNNIEGVVICEGSTAYCGYQSTYTGGICVGNGGGGNCFGSYFKNGGICYANEAGACQGYGASSSWSDYYDETSCCCGQHCPASVPKCASRGIACDPQYLK